MLAPREINAPSLVGTLAMERQMISTLEVKVQRLIILPCFLFLGGKERVMIAVGSQSLAEGAFEDTVT